MFVACGVSAACDCDTESAAALFGYLSECTWHMYRSIAEVIDIHYRCSAVTDESSVMTVSIADGSLQNKG